MEKKKPSLFDYFKGELRWAASTSRAWFRLLRHDRRAAMQSLREGAQSPEFRKRAGMWYAATSFSFNRLRLTAPMLVGAATFFYYALNETSVISSVAFGVLAGFVTHLILLVMPFALIASVPALAFFMIRAMLPPNIPEPTEHQSQVTAEFRDAVDGQGDASTAQPTDATVSKQTNKPKPKADLLAEENRLSPNHIMASKFDGSERPFLLRLLESDGSVILRDPAEWRSSRPGSSACARRRVKWPPSTRRSAALADWTSRYATKHYSNWAYLIGRAFAPRLDPSRISAKSSDSRRANESSTRSSALVWQTHEATPIKTSLETEARAQSTSMRTVNLLLHHLRRRS
jgi:hypothetical protein